MSTLKSAALANYLAVNGSYRAALNSGFIQIFSGPVPATADAALTMGGGGNTLLATISVGGDGTTGLTFDASATGGVLTKTASENWEGPIGATGTASFFRFCPTADNGQGAADPTTGYRLQDTVGLDASSGLILTSTSFVSGNTQTISLFQVFT